MPLFRPFASLLLVLGAALSVAAPARAQTAAPPLIARVDATNVAQGLFEVRLTVPAVPGRLRLLQALWLPGFHGPQGRVAQIGGLVVTAAGRPLAWRRVPEQPQAFEVEVPPGVAALEVRYEWLGAGEDVAHGMLAARDALGVDWPTVLLYPAGRPLREQRVEAHLRLPEGWSWGSALRALPSCPREGWVGFEAESLETLMDSPVYAGRHHRSVALDPPGADRPVTLHLFGDEAARVAISDAQIEVLRRMVRETVALFGTRPWRHYDLLVANGEGWEPAGLEHHESTEITLPGQFLDDWAAAARVRPVLSHELVHAWNGKRHRPAGLLRDDLNTPTTNELLWVYEGLTQYWGWVLAARSGLVTPAQLQRWLGRVAAYDEQQGRRAWRPLQDTVHDAAFQHGEPRWGDRIGSGDYYNESALRLWLAADLQIRELSQGRRSLDDLAHRFFGAGSGDRSGETGPRPYDFDAIVAALQAVQPLDQGGWRAWLRQRLDAVRAPGEPTGLEGSGWRLAFADTRDALDLASLPPKKPSLSMAYSLGAVVGQDGKLTDISWASPAFRNGLAEGDTLVAVQGRSYTPERAEAALKAARDVGTPIEWLVRQGDEFRELVFDVKTGPRHPRLERVPGAWDRLSDILKPLAVSP